MPVNVSFKAELKENFSGWSKAQMKIEKIYLKGLGKAIEDMTKVYVPVKTGALRDSSIVSLGEEPPDMESRPADGFIDNIMSTEITVANKVVGFVTYNTPYAALVHENPNNEGFKYLENAMNSVTENDVIAYVAGIEEVLK